MKIAHVCNYAPGLSGMYGTVRDLLKSERRLGCEAEIIDDAGGYAVLPESQRDDITPVKSIYGYGADIICWHHAMFEDWFNEPHRNLVLFLHGTPEFNYHTELRQGERSLSLLIGLSNLSIPKTMVCMWKRHIPFWENLLQMPVEYVPAWADVGDFAVSEHKIEKDTIKIAMVDFWRLTREPFGLFNAIDYLRKHTDKKIEVNVWGLTDEPTTIDKAVFQWLHEDDVVNIRGNTRDVVGDIYHQNDMVLSMSTEETRVVREAYSCGVPVVCGRHGLHFTQYAEDCIHPENLARAIEDCHNNLLRNTKSTRTRLRKYAEDNFDVDKAGKSVVKIFEDIIEKHGSPNRPKVIKSEGVRMVASVDETAEKVRKGLLNGSPMCYVRCGDGDLLLMDGAEGESYHKNSPKLREELIEAFQHKEEGYLVGSVAGMLNEQRMRKGVFARFEYDGKLQEVVNKLRPGETLENPIALAYKFVFDPQWFISFVRDCIHGKKVLFIGPESGKDNALLKAVFQWETYVAVPDKDAYYYLEEGQRWNDLLLGSSDCDLVICAAGMATRVLAKRLWKSGIKANFIDIGSIVDCLIGNGTRTWIRVSQEEVVPVYEAEFRNAQTDVVVLSMGKEEKTKRCFESIVNCMDHYRVIWVDNGSGAESIAQVTPAAQKLADCDIIKVPSNVGFSKGVNHALRKSIGDAKARYILLLNNDVILTPGCIDRMRIALETGGFDAVGPVTSENNPHSVDALRVVEPSLPEFTTDDIGERAKILWDQYGTQMLEVDNMISFFCCLMPREVIEQIGFLDSDIFAYGEDNDYCIRLRKANRKIGIALGVYVHHDHGATSADFGVEWKNEQVKKVQKYLQKKHQLVG